ncbi:MAG: putative sulfate exporter family transporter [Nitrosomonas sp.]|nr:putative sulfate exporter family transporter [Nitrosomonas sp.]
MLLIILLALLFGIGARAQGIAFLPFIKGFALVSLLALISLLLAAQNDFKSYGIEYAIWAILIGIVISNSIGTPEWASSALQTEFYIKTGLILMGAELMIGKILAIGLPGIFVAWIVTPIVLVATYWFGQTILKITSRSLNITISADMSVCGVSAAIAVAAASKATREELTVAIGLSMIFTAVMMVVMPLFIKFVGISDILGGAWIGGTIDSSGAVVAAGAALGDRAMYVATTIKMIQNILIGIIAFAVAVYFATRVEKTAEGSRIGAGEIWHRFPKFILGFIGASLLFSLLHALLDKPVADLVLEKGVLSDVTRNLRTWFFCLAFASIGLSTNFKVMRHHFVGGKPFVLYICGQFLNLLLTLGVAYLMFYVVFPEITATI